MNSKLFTWHQNLFCDLALTCHFWQVFTSPLNYHPAKSLEGWNQGIYVLLPGRVLLYTSPDSIHPVPMHRWCTCCMLVHSCMAVHKHIQIHSHSAWLISTSRLLYKLRVPAPLKWYISLLVNPANISLPRWIIHLCPIYLYPNNSKFCIKTINE